MKIISIKLFLVTAFLGIIGFAEPPPPAYSKDPWLYSVFKNLVVDLDLMFKEMGLEIYSCQVVQTNTMKIISSYESLTNCLGDSIKNTFKTKNKTKIKVWVLNEKGEYLPPLNLEWKNSQKGWWSLIYEFAYLANEDFFKHFTHDSATQGAHGSQKERPCKINSSDFLEKDLGNIVGDLQITATEPWTLDDYFELSGLKTIPGLKNANKAEIKVTTPEYINGKRIYEARITIQNTYEVSHESKFINLKIRSDLNIVSQRDSCVNYLFYYINQQRGLP